jgi:uncharacterized protein (TIGR04255 family)
MKISLTRPRDLPDFDAPPLDELVLGIQFETLGGYQQIRCGEVWNLYRDNYPNVEERTPLSPSFEIFGGHPSFVANNQFSLIDGPLHDRFWFVDRDGNQIIQFQPDRLLHNWRKVGDSGAYPHFESMAAAFHDEIELLETYANTLEKQSIAINQCEISYINKIAVESEAEQQLGQWVAFWKGTQEKPESVGFSLREILRRENGSPYARMYIDCASGLGSSGKPVFGLTISIKGTPLAPNIGAAMDFLIDGRSAIVKKFYEITTPYAHEKWGIRNV